ncbi:MAG: aldehyde dehydrogenase family protein, partial [Planctomycetota bacterium]
MNPIPEDLRDIPLRIAEAAPEHAGIPIAVTNPWSGETLARVATVNAAGVEAALRHAAHLHADRGGWLPKRERIAILTRAAAIMEERAEMLARVASAEGGKPLIDSRIETARAIDSLRLCIHALRENDAAPPGMDVNAASAGRLAWIRREPVGVVLAFSAFNHPLNLIAHQVGPAVAAGCPVIVKPAETTPLSCAALTGILEEAGLPRGWCQMLLTESHALSGR